MTHALGPQSGNDDVFTARVRLHQSWYRTHVLNVACGTGPHSSSSASYGNMLARADADAGCNSLTPRIFETARARLAQRGGAVEPDRLLHNMLSSQPMCFNLFGPLVEDLVLATTLARALWGERIARVTRVSIEWAPAPAHEYLDDKTAFDAFVEYERPDGCRGFVGIETKLTEPFSKSTPDKAAYRRWMTPDAPWRPDASEAVALVGCNQLWRDHLLARATHVHASSPYAEGSLSVVYHPLDLRCIKTVREYSALLHDTSSFNSFGLDAVVACWRGELGPDSWLDDFSLRYLELDRSEGLA